MSMKCIREHCPIAAAGILMTEAEAVGLLRLAWYLPAPDLDQANAEQAAHLRRYYA